MGSRGFVVHEIKTLAASVLMLGGSLLARREMGSKASGRVRRWGLAGVGAGMCYFGVVVSQS